MGEPMEPRHIKDLSIQELKALAYDVLTRLLEYKMQLQALREEMQSRESGESGETTHD